MSSTAADQSNSMRPILAVVRRRWIPLVLCLVLVTGCVVALSMLQTKEYTATASLLFSDQQFGQELFGANFNTSVLDPTQEQATNIDLVSLPVVAKRTAAVLHLRPGRVAGEVAVSGRGQANIASISVTDPNPVRAAAIANTYAQQYVLVRQASQRAAIVNAQALVKKELAALPTSQRFSSVGQTLQNRGNQLQVLAALQTGDAQVVQSAGVPGAPSKPQTKRNAVLGVLLGLLLGLGLVFLSERLDRRIRSVSELEAAYRVPIVGETPECLSYTSAGTEIVPPAEAAAFAMLRARLRYFNVDRDVRSLLVTSAIPEEGKTTVALNLALAEAEAGLGKVVLLEADLRRPMLARRLGLSSGPGLAEILSRNATLEHALRQVHVPRRVDENGNSPVLSVIPAGAIPPNPAELLESHAMVEFLESLSKQFALILIDTPPTSVVSDAIPLIRLVSGVIVVSRVDFTTRDAAANLHKQLVKLNAPTLGVVANGLRRARWGSYGYGYGYYHSDAVPDPAGQLEIDVEPGKPTARVD